MCHVHRVAGARCNPTFLLPIIPIIVTKGRVSAENVHLVLRNRRPKWTMAKPYIKIESGPQPAQETRPLSIVTGPGSQPNINQTDRKSDHYF